MKCPKYIQEAIRKRANAADKFNDYDWIVSNWCDKNNIEIDSCLTHGGVEAMANPYSAANDTLQAILDSEEKCEK